MFLVLTALQDQILCVDATTTLIMRLGSYIKEICFPKDPIQNRDTKSVISHDTWLGWKDILKYRQISSAILNGDAW